MQDIQNVIRKVKRERAAGTTVSERIEAKFGAIKRVLTSNMEETVRTLREMQSVNEDVYIEALIKPGTRHSHTGDQEVDQLLNIVSDHAYDLVLVSAQFMPATYVQCANDFYSVGGVHSCERTCGELLRAREHRQRGFEEHIPVGW
jgi:hypothetical protein